MTLLEIESFLAVVKAGSITTAAQKLYITQPALSRRIQALEQELAILPVLPAKGGASHHLNAGGNGIYLRGGKVESGLDTGQRHWKAGEHPKPAGGCHWQRQHLSTAAGVPAIFAG